MKGKRKLGVLLVTLVVLVGLGVPARALAAETDALVFRLYNPWSGEHLFTTSADEYDNLKGDGWRQEGVAWASPTSGSPVYRLYNPWSGDHHYTADANEYNSLQKIGWRGEGVLFRNASSSGVPVYRLFNRWLTQGTHLFTTDGNEYNHLGSIGWRKEGTAFYALRANVATPTASQLNALKKAENWSKPSKDWLCDQLQRSYGISKADAQYAVDHCGENWDDNALNKAKSMSGYSRDGLIRSLEQSQFTHDQAVRATDAANKNWNEEAVWGAKDWLGSDGCSRYYVKNELLIDFDGFTESQAEYGVAHCGANWNDQARKRAQYIVKHWYRSEQPTRDAVIQDLMDQNTFGCGFTRDEAVYGVDHCGTKWSN